MNKPRILILSAYDAISHKLWRERLQALFNRAQWSELSLQPRHFAWRIRGNSLLWASKEHETLSKEYDLLIATSMVDLSSLRGFVPSLASIPTLLYVHENQFEYPANRSNRGNVEPLLVPIYAAICADAIAFNSEFNRQSFLKGANDLLAKLPDQFPDSVLKKLASSIVIPVPLPDAKVRTGAAIKSRELSVVWNHRWEYDKGPELLLAIVKKIQSQRLAIKLHIVGQQFREQPVEFAQIDSLLEEHKNATGIARGRFGFVDNLSDYETLLSSVDVVLSTASHDFQGLAIQEACLMGCVPLTPDALAYPEYIPAKFRFKVAKTTEETAQHATAALQRLFEQKEDGLLASNVDLSAYQGQQIKDNYQRQFEILMAQKP